MNPGAPSDDEEEELSSEFFKLFIILGEGGEARI